MKSKWFGRDFDDEMKEKYSDALEKVKSGEYNGWEHDHDGRLAAIILCDQMARNIFRGSGEAFAGDSKARKIIKTILNSSDEKLNLASYRYGEQGVLLMPLMHSENKSDTRQCIIEFTKLSKKMEDDAECEGNAQIYVKFAQDHDMVVQKYGRYPKRNAALGRTSTDAELRYLEENTGAF